MEGAGEAPGDGAGTVEVVPEVGGPGVPDLKEQAESPRLITSAAARAAETSLILLATTLFITLLLLDSLIR